MRIHVTGCNGLLGKYVSGALGDVADVDQSDVETVDVRQFENVKAYLSSHRPDIVVHLAAIQGRTTSREDPFEFFRVNTLGTLNMLEASRQLGIGKLVFMSSLTVHGMSDIPLDECSPVRPVHPYGASKAAAEAYVQAYSKSFGIDAIILRPNFISGGGSSVAGVSLITQFAQDALEKGIIRLAGDGSYQREWLHPQDVAEAIKLAVMGQQPGCEIFVLSSVQHRLQMEELAKRIIARIGKGRIVGAPELEGYSLIANAEKAKEQLGWCPAVGIDAIIDQECDGVLQKA